MLDYPSLESRADALARSFHHATPHRHVVIENLLEPTVAREAARVFPRLEEMDALKDMRQHKAQDPDLSKFHELFRTIVFEHLLSPRFVALVERITGIDDLEVDPKLYAAGLAQSGPGGFLNVHIDNSSHPVEPWYRRLNLLVYPLDNWLRTVARRLRRRKDAHAVLYEPPARRGRGTKPLPEE